MSDREAEPLVVEVDSISDVPPDRRAVQCVPCGQMLSIALSVESSLPLIRAGHGLGCRHGDSVPKVELPDEPEFDVDEPTEDELAHEAENARRAREPEALIIDDPLKEWTARRESSDGEAVEADDEIVTAITGAGVQRRKLNPACPICTGGTGIECSWHFE